MARLSSLLQEIEQMSSVNDFKIRIENTKGDVLLDHAADNAKPTHFIASSTKMMTAATVMKLVTDGVIQTNLRLPEVLDSASLDLLEDFYPRPVVEGITLEMLLRHTSGFADYRKPGELMSIPNVELAMEHHPGWTLAEIVRLSAAMGYDHKRKLRYSGLNYQLLGSAITNATGKSEAQVFEQYVTGPLGLNETKLFSQANIKEFSLHSKLLVGERDYRGANRMASLGFEGSVTSSVSDTMRFLKAYFEDELIESQLRASAQSGLRRLVPGVGLGAGIMSMKLPVRLGRFPKLQTALGHPGMTGHQMLFLPELKLYIVMTPNQIGDLSVGSKLLLRVLMRLNQAI